MIFIVGRGDHFLNGGVIGVSEGALSCRRRAAARVVCLTVELVGCRPRIWRRLVVKESIGLHRLHACVQHLFGWTDYQTHAFAVGDRHYGNPVSRGDRLVADDRTVTLRDLNLSVGRRLIYGYQFGEGWLATIRVERFGPPERGQRYPRCLEGERAGPPETFGSVAAFHRFLRSLRTPDSEASRTWRTILGYDFDPAAFSCEGMNAGLRQLGK